MFSNSLWIWHGWATLKMYFSVNNFTEKSQSCLFFYFQWFDFFMSVMAFTAFFWHTWLSPMTIMNTNRQKNKCFKWRILSQTGKIGSGKNTKFLFFLLGLNTPWGHVLSQKLIVKFQSWAEQSGTQFFRRSNLLVVYKSGPATSI